MNAFARPEPSEYASFYAGYVSLAQGDDVLQALDLAGAHTLEIVKRIPADRSDFRYAEGKWSIKDIFQHLNDGERIFCYRALRFARMDATPLPGFEENDYAAVADTTVRDLNDLLEEHVAIRASTRALFRSFPAGVALHAGSANGNNMSVRALGWVIAGHTMHHMSVIEQRYLPHL